MRIETLEEALADKRERQAPGPRTIADLARALPLWKASHYATYKRRGAELGPDHWHAIMTVLLKGEQPADAKRLRVLCNYCEGCGGSGEVSTGLGPDGAVMEPCSLCWE